MKSSNFVTTWTRAALAAAGALILIGTAQANTVLLIEDFSGSTPGSHGGAIPGTQFTVTSNNIDIIGVLNGSFFSCTQNLAGNCLDLVGDQGAGTIQSVPTFSLLAGTQYTVTFEGVLQGFTAGPSPITNFSVSLGNLTQNLTASPTGTNYSLTFTPLISQVGAELAFSTLSAPDTVHGVVLSNIQLTGNLPSSTPEPSSVLLVSGMLALGLWRKSRQPRS